MTHDPQDIEIVAESLIATYGAQIAQLRSKSVAQGEHPGEECSRLFVERLREFIAPLLALLRESKREHAKTYMDEANDHPPCPLAEDPDSIVVEGLKHKCTCGASDWNHRVD